MCAYIDTHKKNKIIYQCRSAQHIYIKKIIKKIKNKAVKRLKSNLKEKEQNKKKKYIKNETQDTQCRICAKWFSKNKGGEEWIKCQSCNMWDHTECAKVKKTQLQYSCKYCCK